MHLRKTYKDYRPRPPRAAIYVAAGLLVTACASTSPAVLTQYIAIDAPRPICGDPIRPAFTARPLTETRNSPAPLNYSEAITLADLALSDITILRAAFDALAGEADKAAAQCEAEKARAAAERAAALDRIKALNAPNENR